MIAAELAGAEFWEHAARAAQIYDTHPFAF